MNVYCFSGSGHSRAVAEFFAQKLNTDLLTITPDADCKDNIAIVVFPVYCQNIPEAVAEFLKNSKANYIVLIATYGGISHGNVIWEASKLTESAVIAAAYVPMGHSFLREGTEFDSEPLTPIFERISNLRVATLKKERKNVLANFYPALRSRIGIKIERTERCDSCNLCGNICPNNAIQNGKTGRTCIRCMRCVNECPRFALRPHPRLFLRLYLKQKKKGDFVLYL
ncbi:MAG: 4Fe-4S binding protein [Eubacteriales bacterium]